MPPVPSPLAPEPVSCPMYFHAGPQCHLPKEVVESSQWASFQHQYLLQSPQTLVRATPSSGQHGSPRRHPHAVRKAHSMPPSRSLPQCAYKDVNTLCKLGLSRKFAYRWATRAHSMSSSRLSPPRAWNAIVGPRWAFSCSTAASTAFWIAGWYFQFCSTPQLCLGDH